MEMAMVICFWVLFSFRNNLCAVTLRKTVSGFETLASHCKKADWPTPCYSACGFLFIFGSILWKMLQSDSCQNSY